LLKQPELPIKKLAEHFEKWLNARELLERKSIKVNMPANASGPWVPPTPEELGRLLPQFRIECLLGRGGTGAVYKGIQAELERPVAIKLLPSQVAADQEFVARFKREARVLARLQHSRIVTIHDFGQTSEGHLYVVMEYIDGTNLREILRGPGLNPEHALLAISQVCDALYAAHKQGVARWDIKPENVLITREGYVKLGDFGLARPLDKDAEALTGGQVIMGTPASTSSEQPAGQTDHRSDIYTLCVMLYEMLTGEHPQRAFALPSLKVQVDVQFDQAVIKALQQEPQLRYQQVREMKTEVDRIGIAPVGAIQPTPDATTLTARQNGKGKPLSMIVPVAVLLILVLGGLFIWKREHPSAESNAAPIAAIQHAPAETPVEATPTPATIPDVSGPPAPESLPVHSPVTPALDVPTRRFNYTALDKHGHETTGTIDAPSMNDALGKLRKTGFTPKNVTEEGKGKAPRKTAETTAVSPSPVDEFSAVPKLLDEIETVAPKKGVDATVPASVANPAGDSSLLDEIEALDRRK